MESDDELLTCEDVAELAEHMHGYAECEGFRLAYRWLCEAVALHLDAALMGEESEVSEELAGELIDLWAEVSEREIETVGGIC
jgi:hypothetical protein